jgi:hypothetical protein
MVKNIKKMCTFAKNKIVKLLRIKKSFMRLFTCLFVFLFTHSFVSAQTTDSTAAVIQNENLLSIDTNNTIFEMNNAAIDTNKNKTKIHSPKKAGWMSAAVPGLGQIYNKKYWYIKVPIIYGGFVGLSCGININYVYYAKFRDEYRSRLKGAAPSYRSDLPITNINAIKQDYQRKMETFIIVMAVWYFVNILDAVVYAHLLHFDVSDDLSLNIIPSVVLHNSLALNKFTSTTNITFTLKLK